MESAGQEFLRYGAFKLEQHAAQIVRCVRLLSTQELWSRPNEHTNSVANLVLHLTGNVRQWILGGVAGQPVTRDRPAEFAARTERAADALLPAFEETVRDAIAILNGLAPAQLSEPRTIQGYAVTVGTAVFHVVEHFAFHTGQVVHITKTLRDIDLSLYDAHGQRLGPVAAP